MSVNRPVRAALATIALVFAFGATAATPAPVQAAAPTSLYLFAADGFRFQDPNPYACTSTAAMDMLNFVALRGTGGSGFRWKLDRSGARRDSMLAWMRDNDTLKGGYGSDPHGWRNALNFFGWGSESMQAGKRVYEDLAYGSYDVAVKTAVRQMIRFRKPVGILAWAGKHAQMLVGYYGLVGDPFARKADGTYANTFSVSGFYVADPLASQNLVNARVSYAALKSSTNLKIRFRPYLETDSPYDDPYTRGVKPSREEWYNRFVIVAPIR